MIQSSKIDVIFSLAFSRPYLSSVPSLVVTNTEVMRDVLQSRYLRSKVAHKQLARTSLRV